MAEQTTTQRKATAKKAAATRKRNAAARSARSTKSSAKATQTSAKTTAANATSAGNVTLDSVALQAERAVLIPVGAALAARDAVVEATKPFTSRTSAEKELKKFERRGNTARNNVRREVKRTRTRVERELRQRRIDVRTRVGDVRGDLQKQVTEVQSNATDIARKAKEQVAALA
jgi:hypothetical protein